MQGIAVPDDYFDLFHARALLAGVSSGTCDGPASTVLISG